MDFSLLTGIAPQMLQTLLMFSEPRKNACGEAGVTLNSDMRPHKSQALRGWSHQISHLEETPGVNLWVPQTSNPGCGNWVCKDARPHTSSAGLLSFGRLVIAILSSQGRKGDSVRIRSWDPELHFCVWVLRKNSRWPRSSILSSSKRHVKSQNQSRCTRTGGLEPDVWDGTS